MSSISSRTFALAALVVAFAVSPVSDAGVAGYTTVTDESLFDSRGSKAAVARCPEGAWVVATGHRIRATGARHAVVAFDVDPVYANEHLPGEGRNLLVHAHEREPTDEPWAVVARAVCARVD
jgi:hypothetical protein